jgi:hypothetical protein
VNDPVDALDRRLHGRHVSDVGGDEGLVFAQVGDRAPV